MVEFARLIGGYWHQANIMASLTWSVTGLCPGLCSGCRASSGHSGFHAPLQGDVLGGGWWGPTYCYSMSYVLTACLNLSIACISFLTGADPLSCSHLRREQVSNDSGAPS